MSHSLSFRPELASIVTNGHKMSSNRPNVVSLTNTASQNVATLTFSLRQQLTHPVNLLNLSLMSLNVSKSSLTMHVPTLKPLKLSHHY